MILVFLYDIYLVVNCIQTKGTWERIYYNTSYEIFFISGFFVCRKHPMLVSYYAVALFILKIIGMVYAHWIVMENM